MPIPSQFPSTCKIGEHFLDTEAREMYLCTAANTWTTVTAGGAGLPCPDALPVNIVAVSLLLLVAILALLVWMSPELCDDIARRLTLRATERREVLDLLRTQRARRKKEREDECETESSD